MIEPQGRSARATPAGAQLLFVYSNIPSHRDGGFFLRSD